MASQEEQSLEQTSGETLMNAAVNVAPNPRKRPRVIRRPRDDGASGASTSKCARCGSSSHRLIICMKANLLNGLMKGCPWCNTLGHGLTNCPETKHDLVMQLEVIQMRANMPSFQPTQERVDFVRVAVTNGHKPPNGFPWTTQFTKTLGGSLSLYQRGLDGVGFNNRKGLPIDPDTKDWDTAQRRFPPFEGYQKCVGRKPGLGERNRA